MRKLSLALVVACLLAVAPNSRAELITGIDLDTVTLGTLVAGPSTSDFHTIIQTDIGDLGMLVFRDPQDVFTYVMSVTSEVNHISEINLGFAPPGFNGVAGFSYQSVDSIDGGDFDESLAFSVHLDDDGTIDWDVNDDYADSPVWWREGESLALFYQSTSRPGSIAAYNMINSRASTTLNIAPGGVFSDSDVHATPEPCAILLFGTACGLLMTYRLVAPRRLRHYTTSV